MKFTVEDIWTDGSMPLLDTIVIPDKIRALSISVYKKATHTDQYLNWDTNTMLKQIIMLLIHWHIRMKQFVPQQNYVELNNNIYGRS